MPTLQLPPRATTSRSAPAPTFTSMPPLSPRPLDTKQVQIKLGLRITSTSVLFYLPALITINDHLSVHLVFPHHPICLQLLFFVFHLRFAAISRAIQPAARSRAAGSGRHLQQLAARTGRMMMMPAGPCLAPSGFMLLSCLFFFLKLTQQII